MDSLMMPLIDASQATTAVGLKGAAGKKAGLNFSDYMEKKMATERQSENNLFGQQEASASFGRKVRVAVVEQKDLAGAVADPELLRKLAKDAGMNESQLTALLEKAMAVESQSSNNLFGLQEAKATADWMAPVAVVEQKDGADEANTIAAMLGEFVQHLKQSAGDQKQGAGEWSFPVPDPELLQRLARDAGMNESQLTTLMDKMKNQDGHVPLADFLDSFSRHFATLQDEVPVTVSETDLPLLQIFLERLGVPVPEVSRISDAAVRGDNTLDLQQFLAGLQELPGEGIAELTALEAEELQDILAGAGISQQLQRALFPERLPVVEGLAEFGPPLALTLDRLKNMLEQTVGEVKANRLQADPLSFLADLQEVLSRSGFETKGPSLSSAVQGAMVAVFEKLMESVDLAKVKIQQGSARADAVREEKGLEHWQEVLGAKKGEGEVLVGKPESKQLQGEGRDALAAGASAGKGVSSGELFVENNGLFQSEAVLAAKGEGLATANVASQAARPFVNIPNLPPGLQQQSFTQLSEGVLQGLRNQEHHLVLKLYPKELGEVKVEMTVRDNQVAVSFVMENSRVKAVLESNLEQFRENMEKQGFVIDECMVSLNRDSDSNESWQQFQAASQQKGAEGRRTTLADLPDDALYQRALPGNNRESGVDLFA